MEDTLRQKGNLRRQVDSQCKNAGRLIVVGFSGHLLQAVGVECWTQVHSGDAAYGMPSFPMDIQKYALFCQAKQLDFLLYILMSALRNGYILQKTKLLKRRHCAWMQQKQNFQNTFHITQKLSFTGHVNFIWSSQIFNDHWNSAAGQIQMNDFILALQNTSVIKGLKAQIASHKSLPLQARIKSFDTSVSVEAFQVLLIRQSSPLGTHPLFLLFCSYYHLTSAKRPPG